MFHNHGPLRAQDPSCKLTQHLPLSPSRRLLLSSTLSLPWRRRSYLVLSFRAGITLFVFTSRVGKNKTWVRGVLQFNSAHFLGFLVTEKLNRKKVTGRLTVSCFLAWSISFSQICWSKWSRSLSIISTVFCRLCFSVFILATSAALSSCWFNNVYGKKQNKTNTTRERPTRSRHVESCDVSVTSQDWRAVGEAAHDVISSWMADSTRLRQKRK